MLHERFQQLKAEFPEFTADYTPPWGLPTEADFAELAEQYGVRYPPSFIFFQTEIVRSLPSPDNGFRYAKPGLEPYLSLEAAIKDARKVGVYEELAPFRFDNGDYTCFDMKKPDANGECPSYTGTTWIARQCATRRTSSNGSGAGM